MIHAQIAVLDEQGANVWSGSLYRFAKDNGLDAVETGAITGQFRVQHDRPEPVVIGGGAAPTFYLSLLA